MVGEVELDPPFLFKGLLKIGFDENDTKGKGRKRVSELIGIYVLRCHVKVNRRESIEVPRNYTSGYGLKCRVRFSAEFGWGCADWPIRERGED